MLRNFLPRNFVELFGCIIAILSTALLLRVVVYAWTH